MKKFLILLLVLGTAAESFAQFSWKLHTDFNIGLLSYNVPAGERTEKLITDKKIPNVEENNPINAGRGDYTYTSGGLDLFTYGKGDWLRHNELRLIVDFKGHNVELHTRTLLDSLVRPDLYLSPGAVNSTTGDHTLVMGSGRTVNWNDLLRFSFDEYYIKGNAMFLTGYVGNTPDRGKVEGFNAFTDDVLRDIYIEHYGVNMPAADAGFVGNGQDINNFMSKPGTPGEEDPFEWVMPYFMIGARFGMSMGRLQFPVTFQIAADPGNNTGVFGNANYKRYNGSLRISAEQIAGIVTFDALYRFRGGQPNDIDNYDPIYNPEGTKQPDGSGFLAHAFGLYANIHSMPKLGIGLGYSAYLMTYQDDINTIKGELLTRSGPLYSGFDLRLQYAGFDKIIITFNNNISFANTPPTKGRSVSVGVLGTDLDIFTAQNWFALYNALGLDFHLNNKLTASFQIANRYGLIINRESLPGIIEKTERSRMQLGGGGYVAFQFNRFLLFQGGVSFRSLNESYSNSNPAAQLNQAKRNASGGTFDIAIPLRVNILFGKSNLREI